MKKLVPLFTILAILGRLLPISAGKVAAYVEKVDQQNTVISQGYVVIYNYGWNQTFTPTFNFLTKVQVYLKDRRTGSGITLTIRDETQGTLIVQSSHRMDDGNGWEIFSLPGEGSGYLIVPGNLHSIWIETAYYSEEPVPKWVKSGTNSYGGGTRRQNQTTYSDDLPFATWGYSTEEEEPTPEEPTVDEPPSENPPEDGEQKPAQKKDASDAQAQEVDENIEAPELSYIKKNDEQMDAPIEGEVEFRSSDTLEIVGTAFPNATVVIFIGDNAYTITADENGDWTVLIDLSKISEGTYTVQAQAKNEEGIGSVKTDLYILKKLADEKDEKQVEINPIQYPTLWEKLVVGPYRPFTLGGLVFLLVGLIALLLFIVWKREKKEKEAKKENKKFSSGEQKMPPKIN